VGLVMRVVLLRTTNGLFHRWVRETTLNAHNHGLVLLVAYDNAMQCTLRHLEPLIPSISTWRATSASQQPLVWRFWSFSRVPASHRPLARAQAHRRASAPQSASFARDQPRCGARHAHSPTAAVPR